MCVCVYIYIYVYIYIVWHLHKWGIAIKKMTQKVIIKKSLVKKYVNMLLFSCSVVSNSLWPHELQHSRLTHPSLSPKVCSNSCAHWVDDAVQPSHPLLPSFPPCLSLPQIQDLFQSAGSSHQVAKVLELQHQSFQWIFGVNFL